MSKTSDRLDRVAARLRLCRQAAPPSRTVTQMSSGERRKRIAELSVKAGPAKLLAMAEAARRDGRVGIQARLLERRKGLLSVSATNGADKEEEGAA